MGCLAVVLYPTWRITHHASYRFPKFFPPSFYRNSVSLQISPGDGETIIANVIRRRRSWLAYFIARMFHELASRVREDGLATWPTAGTRTRGALEQYVAECACPEPAEGRSEDARKEAHILSRSHARV